MQNPPCNRNVVSDHNHLTKIIIFICLFSKKYIAVLYSFKVTSLFSFKRLCNVYYMSRTALRLLHMLTNLILFIALCYRNNYYTHFIEEETDHKEIK